MKVSGQAPSIPVPEKEPPIAIGQEIGGPQRWSERLGKDKIC
jgi:hypothetical protein